MMTCECGKRISDVEYIRYGGVCKECWHKYMVRDGLKVKCYYKEDKK